MATTPGQRFVRRHNAARGATSNTTAADISYDTAVISEGGYSWLTPEVTVDEAGLYLCLFDIGEITVASTRAVGTLVPSVNTTDQTLYKARHRYLRNSGGTHNASWGTCILDLAASDDVKVRNPGVVSGTDALGNYATNVNQGGGFQLIRLPAGNFTEVQRTTSQSPITITYANATRPWIDSTLLTTQITFTSEVRDDDGLYPGTGGDLTLAANTKYLVIYGATFDGSSNQRHTHHLQLEINGNNVQHSTGYERTNASDGPPMQGMYLHETGGTAETLRLNGGVEQEDIAVSNTVGCDNAYVQVLELPSSAEWIHVDNGATNSLDTALAGTTTYYDTPLSSTFRVDGDSNLSLDGTNNAVQNDSGGSLPVLAIGWHMWDRDTAASGTRKHCWSYWDNNGTRIAYGISGGYNRGQQGNDDTHRLGYVAAATMDLANAADLSFSVRDPVSGANSNMGIYASTSRYFLGVQVLNLNTLEAAADIVSEPGAGSLSLSGLAPSAEITHTRAVPVGNIDTDGLVPTTAQGVKILTRPGGLHLGNVGLLLRGITPTILIEQQSVTALPDAGSLSLTGLVPSAEIDAIRQVPAGSLSLTGLAPTAETEHIRQAPRGTLSLTGLAPSAEIQHNRSIPVGSIALTGLAPSVEIDAIRQVPVGGLSLTGLVPSAEITHIRQVPVGSLSLTGEVPSAEEIHVSEMSAGSLQLLGQSPVADSGDSVTRQPGTGTAVLTGLAPSAEITHNRDVPRGTLTLTPLLPTISVDQLPIVAEPPNASLALAGLDPTIAIDQLPIVAEPALGALVLTGLDPTIAVAAPGTVSPLAGALILTGQTPTVVTPIAEAERPSGGYGARNWYDAYRQRQRKKEPEKEPEIEIIEAVQRQFPKKVWVDDGLLTDITVRAYEETYRTGALEAARKLAQALEQQYLEEEMLLLMMLGVPGTSNYMQEMRQAVDIAHDAVRAYNDRIAARNEQRLRDEEELLLLSILMEDTDGG